MDLTGYLKRLKLRKPENSAKTYIESIVLPYLSKINWQNETLEKDLRLFWISVYKYNRSHTIYEFKRMLSWIEHKNLFPGQIIKVLLKK